MPNEKELLTGKIRKIAWQFAIPSIISMVVFTLYNIVDRIFIGNIPEVGSLAMTGVGITAPITTIAFAFSMLMGVGAAALISLKMGERKPQEANRVFNNGLEVVVIMAVVIMILTWLLMEPVLNALGADASTLPFAKDYLKILVGGIIFSNVNFFLVSCLRGIGHPQVATICNVIGTVLNIILDAVFVFGFKWGIAGAAWATIISQFASCMMSAGFFYWKRSELSLRIKRPNWKIDKQIMLKTMRIGFAPFAMQATNALLLILLNNTLKKYGGNEAIASLTIMFSIQNLVTLPMIGYMQGQQPIIGFNYGAKNYSRVKKVLQYAIKVTMTMGIVCWLLVEIFPTHLVRLFASDTGLVESTVFGLRLFLASIGFLGIKFVITNYCQFIGKAKMATFLSLSWTIFFIPLMFILAPLWGVNGIWVAGGVADVLGILFGIFILKREWNLIPKEDGVPTIDNFEKGEKLADKVSLPEVEILEELSGI